MSTQGEKFYITTSIPYATAPPHLGHILDPLIADVLARYRRIKGDDVRFLVGTDEHGAKVARMAETLGKTPKDMVDENSEKYREMHKAMHISWDDFVRTSDRERHWPGAQNMWRALKNSGDIYWKKYRGLYCVGHEAFITDKDLVGGVCQDHQKAPEVIEEENWFFRLSKYADRIAAAISSGEFKVLPEQRKNEILSFIKSGLEDVSVSRPSKDISWGVPVPDDSSQTMYVWLEALTSYISSAGYGREGAEFEKTFRKWWPADVQVVGKDNLRFHAAIWPGMLLSAGLALPKTLFVHGFVNVDGHKISKTVGNVIAPREVVEKYGTDAVRYYFLREFPSQDDGDFSYRKFEDRYNGDLANGIGNLTARISALGQNLGPLTFRFEGDIEEVIRVSCDDEFKSYESHLSGFRLNEALADAWRLGALVDKYLNDKKPWTSGDKEKKRIVVNAAYAVSAAASMIEPFLPDSAAKIKEQIRIEDSVLSIKRGDTLFPRLK